MAELLVRARTLLAGARQWCEHAGLVIRAGRVERVVCGPGALARAARRASRRLDLGDVLIAPGLINAHAHLELGALAGRTPQRAEFSTWVRAVIAAKAGLASEEFRLAVREGARASLAGGATVVADIDSSGATEGVGARVGPRLWVMRELIDAYDPLRTAAALDRVRAPLSRRARVYEGFSPHAPFTVSPALALASSLLARRRKAPVATHWSETPAEVEWLSRGSGPLAALLGPSPRCSGLELLSRAGLLRAPLALIHGNHPARGEAARIASAGAVVVHCPGSHRWFGREPFPWREYTRAGVSVALGTDSLASNEALDMRRELRLARASAPWLSVEALFEMATSAGARALGVEGRAGVLAPGAFADFALYRCAPRSRRAALEAVLDPEVVLESTWVAGRVAWRAP